MVNVYDTDEEFNVSDELKSILKTTCDTVETNTGENMKNTEPNKTGFVDEKEHKEKNRIGKYIITKTLGSGSSSNVKLGLNLECNEKVAIKIIPRKKVKKVIAMERQKIREERIFREVIISSLLNHPYIVRLVDFLYSSAHFFLVFEYANGQQLFDIIVEKGPISESETRRIFRQLLSAVDYFHQNSIVHRDIKIENIIIDENGNVKLFDFGLSNFYDNKRMLSTFCGSLYFAAPELLSGLMYMGPEIDVWSLGIILYVMLCGTVPFDDKNINVLQEKIKSGQISFPKNLSEDVKKLVCNMIVVDPLKRMALEQIMENKWINFEYETKIQNHVSLRQPVVYFDEGVVCILESVLKTQFPDLRKEIKRYIRLCKEESNLLEKSYWSKKPSVSLYYLFLEGSKLSIENQSEGFLRGSDLNIYQENNFMPENIFTFIRFLEMVSKNNLKCRFYSGQIFDSSLVNDANRQQSIIINENRPPMIRNSILQGFFRGYHAIKYKEDEELKQRIISSLRSSEINYDANNKNYFCSVVTNKFNCFFKVSLFFNIIMRRYIVSFHYISGCKINFNRIKSEIIEKLECNNH